MLREQDVKKLKKWLTGMLQHEAITIEFKKRDGTIRTMKCTLCADLVPPELQASLAKVEYDNPSGTQIVFDLEKLEFRSFQWTSIQAVRFSL